MGDHPRRPGGTGVTRFPTASLFKGMLAGQQIRPHRLKLRHRVAVLTMAYLAAFSAFGYGCVLDDAFDTVRLQADYPDRRVTPWVDTVRINLRQHELNGTVWATSSGLPFIFGWHGVRGSALELHFRRFLVRLPGGHWLVQHDPGLLLPAIIEPQPVLHRMRMENSGTPA